MKRQDKSSWRNTEGNLWKNGGKEFGKEATLVKSKSIFKIGKLYGMPFQIQNKLFTGYEIDS